MSLEQYAEASEISYPTISVCPLCGARKTLDGHGYYPRNGLVKLDLARRLWIHRLLCTVCHRTVSLLPWFLLPRFQYSLMLIVDSLRKKKKVYHQLLQHWRRRFLRNLNVIIAFLRDLLFCATLPRAPDEKAIRLLRTIEIMGPTMFSALFHKRFRRSFMAT